MGPRFLAFHRPRRAGGPRFLARARVIFSRNHMNVRSISLEQPLRAARIDDAVEPGVKQRLLVGRQIARRHAFPSLCMNICYSRR